MVEIAKGTRFSQEVFEEWNRLCALANAVHSKTKPKWIITLNYVGKTVLAELFRMNEENAHLRRRVEELENLMLEQKFRDRTDERT